MRNLPRIVRHEQFGDTLEKLEGAHMAVDPVRQLSSAALYHATWTDNAVG
jgi:hypothetical protein